MTKTIHGIIHGKIIELDEDLGVAEGQQVEITVRTLSQADHRPGEGFLRTEGALDDDSEWDAIMEEIYHARKQEQRLQTPQLEEP